MATKSVLVHRDYCPVGGWPRELIDPTEDKSKSKYRCVFGQDAFRVNPCGSCSKEKINA